MLLKSGILIGSVATRSGYNVSNNPVCVQCVRWRKGRWLPVAKSKMFRIPERKPEDAAERAELMRLHNNYRTQIRTIRSYLIQEYNENKDSSMAEKITMTPEEEEADFEQCLAQNTAWNSSISKIRDERITKQMAERREYILTRLDLKEEREREAREAAEEIVRMEKELSKTFISREKLDEAIEYALANPVDYNFAIDLKENIFKGNDADTNAPEDAIAKAQTA